MAKSFMGLGSCCALLLAMTTAYGQEASKTTTEGKPGSAAATSAPPSSIEISVRAIADSLVEQKVLTPEQADKLVVDAMAKAKQAGTVVVESPPPGEKVIRVPYVPEVIRNQIRDEIRSGLREDTVNAVIAQAKQERWGVPGVLPDWVDRIKIKGDMRFRVEHVGYAKENVEQTYFDFNAINRAGGNGKAGINQWLNTTTDRDRLRIRGRIETTAKVNDEVLGAVRLTTGNTTDPVSTNATLGNNFNRSTVVWDQAYLRYEGHDRDNFKWITLWGGRFPNPFFSTDLVWDADVNLEGISTLMRYNLASSDGLMDVLDENRILTFTVGAFPLKEMEIVKRDKWVYGAQLAADFQLQNQSTFKLGLAYYSYDNIVGQRNSENDTTLDYTASDFFQKGNTLFDIRNDIDPDTNLYALATNYKLVNLTANWDVARFAPHHVVITADYVKNFGFDKDAVFERTGLDVEPKTKGYSMKLSYGWPRIADRYSWRVSAAYRYLERDAVLDAFTDSDFHLGGTDAKGYVLSADYAVLNDTWLTISYLSADAIDGPQLGIDTVQVDFNTRF